MIAAGVNAKALSSYMGHAGISITLDRYGHLMPGSEAQAAGMLDSYLITGAPGLRQRGQKWPPAPGTNGAATNGQTYALLAANLAARRRALGLTQGELAQRSGMSPALISRIESGRQPPTVRTLMRLADGLGASLSVHTGRRQRCRGRRGSPLGRAGHPDAPLIACALRRSTAAMARFGPMNGAVAR